MRSRQATSVTAISILLVVASMTSADDKVRQNDAGYLHGEFARLTKPVQEHDLPGIESVTGIAITPDGGKAIVHQSEFGDQPFDRVSVVDVATGKVERVLTEDKLPHVRHLRVADDGRSVFMFVRTGMVQYDLATGKALKTFDPPEGKRVTDMAYSADGHRMAGAVRADGAAALWDFMTGRSSLVKLSFVPEEIEYQVYPLSARNELLVTFELEEGNKKRIVLFDPVAMTAKTVGAFPRTVGLLPAVDGKRAFLFRHDEVFQEPSKSIEEWDLTTLKVIRRYPLKPPVGAIGASLSPDEGTLYLHENMVQSLVIWNLKQDRIIAVVGPERGGFRAYGLSRDRKKLVGIVGLWKQGTLQPEKLAVYDISKFVPER
jgi:DNA-binding beta-propeller fold protein YncE